MRKLPLWGGRMVLGGLHQRPWLASAAAPTYQPESTALFAAMTVQPDATRKGVIDTCISSLKTAGVWTLLDFLHLLAAHDAQAARINWINPAQVASVNGACVFTTDRGYHGDGVSAYLGCGFNWNGMTHYLQDDAALGIWCQNDAQSTAPIIGMTSTARAHINPRSGTNNLTIRLNCGTQGSVAMAISRGHVIGTRVFSTSFDIYKDGAFNSNIVQTSALLVAEEVVLLRHQASYNSTQTLAGAHGGSHLTAAQITSITNALASYMSSIGA